MKITDEKKLLDIQKEFSDKFPGLKIEFYKKDHQEHQGSLKEDLLESHKTIGEVREPKKKDEVSINGHLKVSTLEKNIHEMFGLNAQIFRRSGDIWLQTTCTDDWTLAAQNKRGTNSVNSKNQ